MKGQKKLLAFKILLFVFAFFIAFMPATAARSKEVNSRVIVEIIGIDGTDNGVAVTAQYVMPTEQQGSTSKDTVTVTGKSLTMAVDSLNTALGRRAELGHCSMVVVGEKATPEMLSALMTATDVTADVYLSAAESEAKELISDITDFMKKTGATDADFTAYAAKRAHVATNTLLGFLSDLESASHTAFMPVVEMIKAESQDESGGHGGESGGESDGQGGESESQSGESESQSGEGGGDKQTGMNVEKLAIYTDGHRAGILDKTAARGVAWASAPVEKGILVTDVEYDGKTVKDVSARLLKKLAKVKTDTNGKKAVIQLKAFIEPNGDKFNELMTGNGKSASEAIRKAFADCIKDELGKAYTDALKLNGDPLFIGREFYRNDPDYYENDFELTDITVEFDINVVIK